MLSVQRVITSTLPETDCDLHVFPDLARMMLIGTQSERSEKQKKCAGRRIRESKAQAQQRKIDPPQKDVRGGRQLLFGAADTQQATQIEKE